MYPRLDKNLMYLRLVLNFLHSKEGLQISLTLPSEFWECRHGPKHLVYVLLRMELRASHVTDKHHANWATSPTLSEASFPSSQGKSYSWLSRLSDKDLSLTTLQYWVQSSWLCQQSQVSILTTRNGCFNLWLFCNEWSQTQPPLDCVSYLHLL